jgi:F420H(2)-dependent quinone reductase
MIFRAVNRFHIFLYRSSGGRLWGKMLGSPVLLLTTTGRKTGVARTVPIVYVRDGENYVVIASDRPGWYFNLKGNPAASIEVKGQTYPVTAHEAVEDEAQRLWAKMVAQSPSFDSMGRNSAHNIMILELLPSA